MILVVNLCKEKLHYQEFVKPVEDIVMKQEKHFVKHISELDAKSLSAADKVIICGTSLKDFDYLNYKHKLGFLKSTNKPVLGICAGMQLICLAHGCKLVRGLEIGLTRAEFKKYFLGLQGSAEFYSLHNLAIRDDKALKKNFFVFSKTNNFQAVKHKERDLFGILFHPEVRNKEVITNFIKNVTY